MKAKQQPKPLIESIINTCALALTAYGVQQVTTGVLLGYFAISFGILIEYIKYFGRNKNIW